MRRIKNQGSRIKEGSNSKIQDCEFLAGPDHGWLDDGEGSVVRENPPDARGRKYDLEERTVVFGEEVVRFSKRIPRDPTNNRLIDQVVGAGTSVGANYLEASEGVSKKDFRFSISRCKKEAKETRFFLRMITAAEPGLKDEAAGFIAKPMNCCSSLQKSTASNLDA